MNAYERGKAGRYHVWVRAVGGTGLAYHLDGAKLGRAEGKGPLGRNGMATPTPVEIKQTGGKATMVLPANTMYLILFE